MSKQDEMAVMMKDGVSKGLVVEVIPSIEHFSSGGVYCRVMHCPAGSTTVGKVHLQGQLNVCLAGRFAVYTNGVPMVVSAGEIIESPAGDQRVFHAIEDSSWGVFLATEETDPEKIEQLVVVETEAQYIERQRELEAL